MPLVAIVLLCLVVGATSGVPHHYQCARYCKSTNRNDFEIGKSYLYKYVGTTDLRINGANDPQDAEYTLLTVKSNVNIQPVSTCDYILQLSNVSLINKYTKIESNTIQNETESMHEEFGRKLEQNSLYFSLQDGRIKTLCPSMQEPAWVLNVKRGVLSSFQNSMTDLTQGEIIYEVDVAGDCETSYEVIEDNPLTIVKNKNLNSCFHRVDRSLFWQSMPYDVSKSKYSLPLLKSTHSCTQTYNDDQVLNVSECKESHLLQPFSNGENGAVAHVTQTLVFKGSFANELKEIQGTFGPRKGLIYEQANPEEPNEDKTNILLKILNDIEDHTANGIQVSVPRRFTKLVEALRKMDRNTILKTMEQISSPRQMKFLMDAVPLMQTANGVELMQELYKMEQVTEKQMHSWIVSLMFMKDPRQDIFEALIPLLQGDTKTPATLTITSLIHKYCTHHYCNSDPYIQHIMTLIEEPLGRKCTPKSAEDRRNIVLSLKAIGNAGVISSLDRLRSCYQNAENGLEIRLAGVEAYRRMKSISKDMKDIEEILTDATQHTELRIAAYLTLMRSPTYNTLAKVKDILATEESNQVGSFIWTHLTNIQESSTKWKQFIQDLIGNEFLANKFSTDMRKFSRNYELSTFSESWNAGGSIDSNIIFTPESYLPRSIMLNLTVDLFGETINLLEFGSRFEGFEEIVENLFGPQSYFPSESMKSMLENLKNQSDAYSSRMSEIGNQFRSQTINKEPTATMYARMFGNEFMFGEMKDFEKWDGKKPNIAVQTLLQLFTENNLEYTKSFMFMDSKFSVPTTLGLPLDLVLKGSATVNLTASGKVDVFNLRDYKLQIHGKIHPSAAVEVDGIMSVDAFVTKSSIQMISSLNSNTYLDGHIIVDKGKLIDIKLNMPNKQMDLINIHSNLYIVNNFISHPLSGIIENSENWNACTSDKVSKWVGLQLCSGMHYANASMHADAPHFPLTGPFHYSSRLSKVDYFDSYVFQLRTKTPDVTNNIYQTSLYIGTPNSIINRNINMTYSIDVDRLSLTSKIVSPFTNIEINSKLTSNKAKLGFYFNMKNNHKNLMFIETYLEKSDVKKQHRYVPYLHLYYKDQMLARVSGSLSYSRKSKYNLELEIRSGDMKPVTLNGNLHCKDNKCNLAGHIASPLIKGDIETLIHKENDFMTAQVSSSYVFRESQQQSMDFSFKVQNTRRGFLSRDIFYLNFASTQFSKYNTEINLNSERSKKYFDNNVIFKWAGLKWEFHQLYNMEQINSYTHLKFLCSLSCISKGIDYKINLMHKATSRDRNVYAILKLNDIQKLELKSNYTIDQTGELRGQTWNTELYYPRMQWKFNCIRNEIQSRHYEVVAKLDRTITGRDVTYLYMIGHYEIHNNADIKQSWKGIIELPQLHGILSHSMNVTTNMIRYEGKLHAGMSAPYQINIFADTANLLFELSQNEKLLFYFQNRETLMKKSFLIGIHIYQHFEFLIESSSFNSISKTSNFELKLFWDKDRNTNKKISFMMEQLYGDKKQTRMLLEYPNQKVISVVEIGSHELTMNVTWGLKKAEHIMLKVKGFLALNNGSLSISLHTPFKYLEVQDIFVQYYLNPNDGKFETNIDILGQQLNLVAGGSRQPNTVNGYLQLDSTSKQISKVDIVIMHTRNHTNQLHTIRNVATIIINSHIIGAETTWNSNETITSTSCKIVSPTKSIYPIIINLEADWNLEMITYTANMQWQNKFLSANLKSNNSGIRFELDTPFKNVEHTLINYMFFKLKDNVKFISEIEFLNHSAALSIDYDESKPITTVGVDIQCSALGKYSINMEHSKVPFRYEESIKILKNAQLIFKSELKGWVYSLEDIFLQTQLRMPSKNLSLVMAFDNDVQSVPDLLSTKISFSGTWNSDHLISFLKLNIDKNISDCSWVTNSTLLSRDIEITYYNNGNATFTLVLPPRYSINGQLNYTSLYDMECFLHIQTPERDCKIGVTNDFIKHEILHHRAYVVGDGQELLSTEVTYSNKKIWKDTSIAVDLISPILEPVSLRYTFKNEASNFSLTYGNENSITADATFSFDLPIQMNVSIVTPFSDRNYINASLNLMPSIVLDLNARWNNKNLQSYISYAHEDMDIKVFIFDVENEMLPNCTFQFWSNFFKISDEFKNDVKIETTIPGYEKLSLSMEYTNDFNRTFTFTASRNKDIISIELLSDTSRSLKINSAKINCQSQHEVIMDAHLLFKHYITKTGFLAGLEGYYQMKSYVSKCAYHLESNIVPSGFIMESTVTQITRDVNLESEFKGNLTITCLNEYPLRTLTLLIDSNKSIQASLSIKSHATLGENELDSKFIHDGKETSLQCVSRYSDEEGFTVKLHLVPPENFYEEISAALSYNISDTEFVQLTSLYIGEAKYNSLLKMSTNKIQILLSMPEETIHFNGDYDFNHDVKALNLVLDHNKEMSTVPFSGSLHISIDTDKLTAKLNAPQRNISFDGIYHYEERSTTFTLIWEGQTFVFELRNIAVDEGNLIVVQLDAQHIGLFKLDTYFTKTKLEIEFSKDDIKYVTVDADANNLFKNSEILVVNYKGMTLLSIFTGSNYVLVNFRDIYKASIIGNLSNMNIVVSKHEIPLMHFSLVVLQSNIKTLCVANLNTTLVPIGYQQMSAELALTNRPTRQVTFTLMRDDNPSITIDAKLPTLQNYQFSTIFNVTTEFKNHQTYFFNVDFVFKEKVFIGDIHLIKNDYTLRNLIHFVKHNNEIHIKVIPLFSSLNLNVSMTFEDSYFELLSNSNLVTSSNLHFIASNIKMDDSRNLTLFMKSDNFNVTTEFIFYKHMAKVYKANLNSICYFAKKLYSPHMSVEYSPTRGFAFDYVVNKDNYGNISYNLNWDNTKLNVNITQISSYDILSGILTIDLDLTEDYKGTMSWHRQNTLNGHFDVHKDFLFGTCQINTGNTPNQASNKHLISWAIQKTLSSELEYGTSANVSFHYRKNTGTINVSTKRTNDNFKGHFQIDSTFKNYEKIVFHSDNNSTKNHHTTNTILIWPNNYSSLNSTFKITGNHLLILTELSSPFTSPFEVNLETKDTSKEISVVAACNLEGRKLLVSGVYIKGSEIRTAVQTPWDGYSTMELIAGVDKLTNSARVYFNKENVATEFLVSVKTLHKALNIELLLRDPNIIKENYMSRMSITIDPDTLVGDIEINLLSDLAIIGTVGLQPDNMFLKMSTVNETHPITIEGSYIRKNGQQLIDGKFTWRTVILQVNLSLKNQHLIAEMNMNNKYLAGIDLKAVNFINKKAFILDMYFPNKESKGSLKISKLRHRDGNEMNFEGSTSLAALNSLNFTSRYNKRSFEAKMMVESHNVAVNLQTEINHNKGMLIYDYGSTRKIDIKMKRGTGTLDMSGFIFDRFLKFDMDLTYANEYFEFEYNDDILDITGIVSCTPRYVNVLAEMKYYNSVHKLESVMQRNKLMFWNPDKLREEESPEVDEPNFMINIHSGKYKLEAKFDSAIQSLNLTSHTIDINTLFTGDQLKIHLQHKNRNHRFEYKVSRHIFESTLQTPFLAIAPIRFTHEYYNLKNSMNWNMEFVKDGTINSFECTFVNEDSSLVFRTMLRLFNIQYLSINFLVPHYSKQIIEASLDINAMMYAYNRLTLEHVAYNWPIITKIHLNASGNDEYNIMSSIDKDSFMLIIDGNNETFIYLEARNTENDAFATLQTKSLPLNFEIRATDDLIHAEIQYDMSRSNNAQLSLRLPLMLSSDFTSYLTFKTNTENHSVYAVYQNLDNQFKVTAMTTNNLRKIGFNFDLNKSPLVSLDAELHLPDIPNLIITRLTPNILKPDEHIINYVKYLNYTSELSTFISNKPENRQVKATLLLPIKGYEKWSMEFHIQRDENKKFTSKLFYPGLDKEYGVDLRFFCKDFNNCNISTMVSVPKSVSTKIDHIHLGFTNYFYKHIEFQCDYNNNKCNFKIANNISSNNIKSVIAVTMNDKISYTSMESTMSNSSRLIVLDSNISAFNVKKNMKLLFSLNDTGFELDMLQTNKSILHFSYIQGSEIILSFAMDYPTQPIFFYSKCSSTDLELKFHYCFVSNRKNCQYEFISTPKKVYVKLNTNTLSYENLKVSNATHAIKGYRCTWNDKSLGVHSHSERVISNGKQSTKSALVLELYTRGIQFAHFVDVGLNFDRENFISSLYQIQWDSIRKPLLISAIGYTIKEGFVEAKIKHFEFEHDLILRFLMTQKHPLHIVSELQYSPRLDELIQLGFISNQKLNEHSFSVKHLVSKIDHKLTIKRVKTSKLIDASIKVDYLDFNTMEDKTLQGLVEINYVKAAFKLGVYTNRNHINVASSLLKGPDNTVGFLLRFGLTDEEPLTMRCNVNPDRDQLSVNVDFSYGNSRIYNTMFSVPSRREITSKVTHEVYGHKVTDAQFTLKLNSSQLLWSKILWRTDVWSTFQTAILHKYTDALYVIDAIVNDTLGIVDDDAGQALFNEIHQINFDRFNHEVYEVYRELDQLENDVDYVYNENVFYLKSFTDHLNKYLSIRTALRDIAHVVKNVHKSIKNVFSYILDLMKTNYAGPFNFISNMYVTVQGKLRTISASMTSIVNAKTNIREYLLSEINKIRNTVHSMKAILMEHLESFEAYIAYMQNILKEFLDPWLSTLDDIVAHFEQKLIILQLSILDFMDTVQNYVTNLKESKYLLEMRSSYLKWINELKLQNMLKPIQDQIEDILDILINDFKMSVEHYKPYLDAVSVAVLGKHKNIQDLPFFVELKSVSNEIYQRALWLWRYHNVSQHIENLLENGVSELDDILIYLSKYLNENNNPEFEPTMGQNDYIFRPDLGLIEIKQALPVEWDGFDELPKFEQHPIYMKIKRKFEHLFQIRKYHYDLYDAMQSYTLSDPIQVLYPVRKLALLIDNKHYITFNGKYYGFSGNCSYVLASDFIDETFMLVVNYERKNGNDVQSFTLISDKVWNIHINANQTVLINNEKTELPIIIGNNTITKSENVLTIVNENGLKFWCNSHYKYCALSLSGWYFGKTGGLFGTLDNEHITDMALPNGTWTNDIEIFSQGWQVSDECSTTALNKTKPSNEFYNNIVDTVCTNIINSLAKCFTKVDPAPYFSACKFEAVNIHSSTICSSVAAYVAQCRHMSINVDMPSYCVHCPLTPNSKLDANEVKVYDGNNFVSSDIVFIVQHGNGPLLNKFDAVISQLDSKLKDFKITDNRYAFVAFGNPNYSEPHICTNKGMVWSKTSDFKHVLRSQEATYEDIKQSNDVVYEALVYAAQLDFRPAVSRIFIILQSEFSTENDKFTNTLDLLGDADITIHVLKPNILNEYDSSVLGVDGNSHLISNSDVHSNKTIQTELQDAISLLAFELNGTIFDINKLITSKDDDKNVNIWMKNISNSINRTTCQICTCMTNADDIQKLSCRKCLSPSVKQLLLEYESNSLKFNDESRNLILNND